MSLNLLIKKAERLAIDNSPIILTSFGVIGTITTAYLTGKASIKAVELMGMEDDRIDLDWREKIQMTWKLYIPAIGMGTLSCAAIVGANHIGSRRAAAVAAAYSITEKAFTEYRDKVVETLGEKKEQKIRDGIAQDRIERNPLGDRTIIIEGTDVLCYDMFTDRWFRSDMETIKKAQNDTQYQINNDMYASLTDFYDRMGLGRTSYSDDVGWTVDQKLEICFSTVMSPDQKPAIAISFRADPIKGYSRQL